MGDIVKLLLVKVIWLQIVNSGVRALVVKIVKILGDANLGIRQIEKDGPVTDFKFLRFVAGPQAFHLRVVVVFALPGTTAPAVRELGLGLVK